MKTLLITLFLLLPTSAFSQCVATALNVLVDDERGTIQVVTQYELNGKIVHTGTSGRYDENSASTPAELKQKIIDDTKIHCAELIARMPENALFRFTKKKETQESKIIAALNNIKFQIEGQSVTVNKYEETFKDKVITVFANGTATIKDAP